MKKFGLLICVVILGLPACRTPDRPSIKPLPIIGVVYVRPFTLNEGYRHDWSLARPFVTSGALAVFEVDPKLVVPRNAAEPVLYVGNQTAQRLNRGDKSGHVVALIPGNVDLAQVPIWFGSPSLPERATAKSIRVERAAADRAGITPFAAATIQGVTRSAVQAENLPELLRKYAAELVLEYSPQERQLAETWRLPVVGP